METPKNGVARKIAGTIPINVLNKAVAVSPVTVSYTHLTLPTKRIV